MVTQFQDFSTHTTLQLKLFRLEWLKDKLAFLDINKSNYVTKASIVYFQNMEE